MPPPNKALSDTEAKLTTLLLEIRGTPTAERVKLYVSRMTGGKLLSEYLHDETIPVRERGMIATTLVDILLGKDYSRLPDLPGAPAAPAAKSEPVAVEPVSPSVDTFTPEQREAIRATVRAEVRRELGEVMLMIGKILKG